MVILRPDKGDIVARRGRPPPPVPPRSVSARQSPPPWSPNLNYRIVVLFDHIMVDHKIFLSSLIILVFYVISLYITITNISLLWVTIQ